MQSALRPLSVRKANLSATSFPNYSMKTNHAFRAFAALFLFLTAEPVRAVIDLDTDGVSDIWRLKFSAPALAPAADADGDGKSNADEAKAGTDPFSPTDIIKVTSITLNAGNIEVQWPSIIGKRYKVQSTTTLNTPGSWADATGFLDGSGAPRGAIVRGRAAPGGPARARRCGSPHRRRRVVARGSPAGR